MFFRHISRLHTHGLSLSELLVVLAIVSLSMHVALPTWQLWQERQQAQLARDRLVMDVQSARTQALYAARNLVLQATQDCPWHSHNATDWSCGWQLIDPQSTSPLQTTALPYPLQVRFTKSTPLIISAHGDLGQVGDRWTVQSRAASTSSTTAAYSLCLSNAGRLRTVASPTCN